MKSSSLKKGKRELPKADINPGDIYRELGIYPGDHLQGADIVRFIEFLISVTQTKQAPWKIINERVAELRLFFLLEMIEPYRARRKRKMKWKNGKQLEDEWEVVIEKVFKQQEAFSKTTCRGKASFQLSVTNKFHCYLDEVGTWEVPIWDKEKELLSMRIEALWEVVYTNNFIGRMFLKKSA